MACRKKVRTDKRQSKSPKFDQDVSDTLKEESDYLNSVIGLAHRFANQKLTVEKRLSAGGELQGLLFACEGHEVMPIETIKKCCNDGDEEIQTCAAQILAQIYVTEENWEAYKNLLDEEGEVVVAGVLTDLSTTLFLASDFPNDVCDMLVDFLRSDNADIATSVAFLLIRKGYDISEIASKLSEEALQRLMRIFDVMRELNKAQNEREE